MSGKQEPPSGLASQQLSRLPSDEHICLSPPWNEEDDGPVRVGSLFDFSVVLLVILDYLHVPILQACQTKAKAFILVNFPPDF